MAISTAGSLRSGAELFVWLRQLLSILQKGEPALPRQQFMCWGRWEGCWGSQQCKQSCGEVESKGFKHVVWGRKK